LKETDLTSKIGIFASLL